jgi:hypothetical protein
MEGFANFMVGAMGRRRLLIVVDDYWFEGLEGLECVLGFSVEMIMDVGVGDDWYDTLEKVICPI